MAQQNNANKFNVHLKANIHKIGEDNKIGIILDVETSKGKPVATCCNYQYYYRGESAKKISGTEIPESVRYRCVNQYCAASISTTAQVVTKSKSIKNYF